MNEREKILEFTISEYETYIIALKKYGSSDEIIEELQQLKSEIMAI